MGKRQTKSIKLLEEQEKKRKVQLRSQGKLKEEEQKLIRFTPRKRN